MTAACFDSVEHAGQRACLRCDVGAPGSGAARYAAAMYFFQRQLMSQEMLEIYRRCCKFDLEDPIDLANFEGVAVPPVALADRSVPAA